MKIRKELNSELRRQKNRYFTNINFLSEVKMIVTNETIWKIWKYVKYIYICQYYKKLNGVFNKINFLRYRIKKNNLGLKLGLEIHEDSIDKGLIIYHNNIVINRKSKIGKNCSLHGMNCIGNNGKNDLCPTIGDNVEIGSGAIIIGNIKIGNNVIIGAGATVVKDVPDNVIVVGNPAKILKNMTDCNK